MVKLNLHDTRPLYVQLADILRKSILLGKYAVGDRMPTETELSVEHKASLTTVKRALAELVHERLIWRRPKIGTFVCSPETYSPAANRMVCLKTAHLFSTEDVDDRVKAIFEKRHRGNNVTFRMLLDPHASHLLSHLSEADLVTGNPLRMRELALGDGLLDLAPFLKDSEIIRKDSFYPEAARPFQVGGAIFGIPQNYNVTMLYCHNRIFADAGVNPLDVNRDRTVFRDAAVALTGGRVRGFGYFPYPSTLWENFMFQDRPDFFDWDSLRFRAGNSDYCEVFDFLRDLIVEKKCGINLDRAPHGRWLAENRVAMVMCGPYLNRVLGDKIGDWTVLPLPPGKHHAACAASFGIGIPRCSKNPALAWKFIELYCGEIGQSLLGAEFHAMPAHRESLEKRFAGARRPLKNTPAFAAAALTAKAMPLVLFSEELRMKIASRFAGFLSGDAGTKTFAGDLRSSIDGELEKLALRSSQRFF